MRPLPDSEFSLENEVFKRFLQVGNFELEPPLWENSGILLWPLPDYVVCIMFVLVHVKCVLVCVSIFWV